MSTKLFSLLFADDSNMFMHGKNVNDLINTMNIELKNVIEWLNVNKLSLNLKKKNTFYDIQKKKAKNLIGH